MEDALDDQAERSVGARLPQMEEGYCRRLPASAILGGPAVPHGSCRPQSYTPTGHREVA